MPGPGRFELRLADGVEEIALVLVGVQALEQSTLAVGLTAPGVVAGGDQVCTQVQGVVEEEGEQQQDPHGQGHVTRSVEQVNVVALGGVGLVFLLVAAGIVAYIPSFWGEFILDDGYLISQFQRLTDREVVVTLRRQDSA